MSEPVQTDVLIVGAGPVGLFLANDCVRRGLRVRLIERHEAQSQHSKALAVFPRTLEIFEMAGLAEPFLEAANRVTGVAFASRERTLGRIAFEPSGTPYRYVAMVPQDVTERILLERLRGRGADVEYGIELTSLREIDGGVEAILERAGARELVTARFAVGCDGAHSTVREALGLEFAGDAYPQQYMLADVMTNDALPADEMQLCPSADGPLAIFPISRTRRRLVAVIDEAEGEAPSLELVNRVLAERVSGGPVAESLVWSSYFRIHHRCVSRMQRGRTFIAGDAAHIHSPFGGQGMNTGLHDAWNLAWKLAFTVRGGAREALLASYTQEREPIVRGVIEATHFLTNALGVRNPIARGFRDAAIPILTHLPALQHGFVDRLSGLGIAYHGSPIVAGSGRRCFDESLRGALGSRFILVAPETRIGSLSREVRERFPDAVEMRASNNAALLVIRPDGYVAYERPSDDSNAVDEIIEILSRQLASDAPVASSPLQRA